MRNFLRDNPQLADEIEHKILVELGIRKPDTEPAAEPAAEAEDKPAASKGKKRGRATDPAEDAGF